jgi:hypothetical protein
MNDIAAGLFLLFVVVPVILGLAYAFLMRNIKIERKPGKHDPVVSESQVKGYVWVKVGKRPAELMSIETATAAGYIKKKEKPREELKSAYGVHLGKG